jgi:hypothetical protein
MMEKPIVRRKEAALFLEAARASWELEIGAYPPAKRILRVGRLEEKELRKHRFVTPSMPSGWRCC